MSTPFKFKQLTDFAKALEDCGTVNILEAIEDQAFLEELKRHFHHFYEGIHPVPLIFLVGKYVFENHVCHNRRIACEKFDKLKKNAANEENAISTLGKSILALWDDYQMVHFSAGFKD